MVAMHGECVIHGISKQTIHTDSIAMPHTTHEASMAGTPLTRPCACPTVPSLSLDTHGGNARGV